MIRRSVYGISVALILLAKGMAIISAQKPQARDLAVLSTAPGTSTLPAGASSQPQAAPQLSQRFPRYVVQLQDVLLLSFPLSPELNQTATVQPDGYINLQSTGSVHVQGLTIPELTNAVKRAYEGILHEPIVNVDLMDFQKPFFTVTGQVSKPGQYELRAQITPLEAIAVAGGLVSTAKTQIFLFHRTSNDWYEVQKLNLKEILDGKHVNEGSIVRPGDIIVVPEKFISNFRKYVPYAINASTYLQPSPL